MVTKILKGVMSYLSLPYDTRLHACSQINFLMVIDMNYAAGFS